MGAPETDRLPHEPRNFRDIVEADLRRAARPAIEEQDEIRNSGSPRRKATIIFR
jgi:hypothetical protein